MKAAAARCT